MSEGNEQLNCQVGRMLEHLRTIDRQYSELIAMSDPRLAEALHECAMVLNQVFDVSEAASEDPEPGQRIGAGRGEHAVRCDHGRIAC